MEGYRELELFIGPFQEWRGQKQVGAIKLVSNGNIDTLRIDADINKTITSAFNSATITIYNLSKETRQAIRKSGVRISIYAGYEGYAKEVAFSGGIMSSVSWRQGPDIITRIFCLAGGGPLARSTTSKTYTYGVPVADVVKEIAGTIPGVVADKKNINVQGTIGYAGWSFAGMTKDALDKLAYQFGFSWSINDGQFVAVQDKKNIGGRVLLNSANGLRKVSPRLTGLMQIQEGVDIQASYYPNVNPGNVVTVRSEMQPDLNGSYEVHTVDYRLAPKTDAWEMNITSFTTYGSWK